MIEKEKQTNKTKNQTSETHKPETANEGSPKNIKLQKGDCRTKHAKEAEEEEEVTIAQDITIKQNLAKHRELNKLSDYSEDEEVKELTNSKEKIVVGQNICQAPNEELKEQNNCHIDLNKKKRIKKSRPYNKG